MSSGNGIITLGEALILGDAIIYLRMSDFRDEDRTTFAAREEQLRDFAAGLGVPAERVRVAIENDAGNGGYRPASAYKRPVRVTTATGLVTMRTRRPVFARVLLDLQTGKAGVLICDDVSRIARDERDALDLIDACELGKASAFSPSEDSADGIGSLRITRGGTREEIRSFRERARAAHDYSADISDKVQRGRKRWAGKSYWGGRRPYGRMIDPSAPKHAKRLITVPEEAKVLQDAVTDVLDRGISLRAVAADLRGRGLRTVTGKPFSAVSLRDALLASHVAGLATCNGAQYDASSWLEPIIEPDRWERLAEMLTDPGLAHQPPQRQRAALAAVRARAVRDLRRWQHHARLRHGRIRTRAGQRLPVRQGLALRHAGHPGRSGHGQGDDRPAQPARHRRPPARPRAQAGGGCEGAARRGQEAARQAG